MDQNKLDDYKDDFTLFVEGGFVAIKQLDPISAKRLFDAAALLNPASELPSIGLGYMALNQLEIAQATNTFKKILEKKPDSQLTQAFLGICYILTEKKVSEGEKIILELIEKAEDPSIKNLALVSLEMIKGDLISKIPAVKARTAAAFEKPKNK